MFWVADTTETSNYIPSLVRKTRAICLLIVVYAGSVLSNYLAWTGMGRSDWDWQWYTCVVEGRSFEIGGMCWLRWLGSLGREWVLERSAVSLVGKSCWVAFCQFCEALRLVGVFWRSF
jgi:hypothetical protein